MSGVGVPHTSKLPAASGISRLVLAEVLVHRTSEEGDRAVEIIVNFRSRSVEVSTRTGGKVALPHWGLVAEAPRSLAFYAQRCGGVKYVGDVLSTLRSARQYIRGAYNREKNVIGTSVLARTTSQRMTQFCRDQWRCPLLIRRMMLPGVCRHV